MKKLFCVFLSIAVFVSTIFSFSFVSFGYAVSAERTRLKNSDTFYEFDASTGTLTISGKGATPDFSNSSASIPWYSYRSESIKKVVVEKGITALGAYLLYQVRATEISLPFGLEIIGNRSLSGTLGVTSWELPFGLKTIGSNAFANCTTITEISFPKTLERIQDKAFYFCSGLESVTIPSSVVTIEESAFSKCSALKSVQFKSMTSDVHIGNNVFMECPQLMELAVPMNASCGTRFFGYKNTTTKYSGRTMYVYNDSAAHIYGIGMSGYIECVIQDTIPMECFVEYRNTYTSDNINTIYHYVFVPENTERYNFYTTGSCDTQGRLCDSSFNEIASDDDIAQSNRNFCISALLTAGETYHLYINSYKMEGVYSAFVYPDEITDFSILEGGVELSASDSVLSNGKRIFDIDRELLSDFIIELRFGDSLVDISYYCNYIAGEYITSGDDQNQSPYTCGENSASLMIKDLKSYYPLTITHSYDSKEIAATEDDDGYTLYSCIICKDSYKADFVPTTSLRITGKVVMAETLFGEHYQDVPYNHATIRVNGRTYNINKDGTFEIRTFDECYAVFDNQYGGNFVAHIYADRGDYDYGTIALAGYDINQDGYVNAKDYAIYYRELRGELGDDYWQFGNEFLLRFKKS